MKEMYCPNYTRVAWSSVGDRNACVRLRCGRWDCEFCAKKNAAIWRAHLIERLPDVSEEWWLLTLTAPPWDRSKMGSFIKIRKAIDALIKRSRRVYGEEIDYVRTYEKHPQSNAIHAHFIISGITQYVALGCSTKLRPMAVGVVNRLGRNGIWTSQSWFKKTCQELKMGRMAHLERIDGGVEKPVGYVCKYLTKAQQDLGIKGLRHVQTSRRIGGPKNDTNPAWHSGPYLTRYTFPKGSQIVDLNTGEIIDDEYWNKYSFWPYD